MKLCIMSPVFSSCSLDGDLKWEILKIEVRLRQTTLGFQYDLKLKSFWINVCLIQNKSEVIGLWSYNF